MTKTKKTVCTMRHAALSLTIITALLCGGASTPAYAAAGFTSLKDIQTEAEAGSAERATPVIGLSIVFDPKSLAQDLKNFVVQQAMQRIQGLMNNNIVGGFVKQMAKQEDVKKALAEVTASVGINTISADDRRQDAKNFVDRELAVGTEAARIRADALATADALCEAASARAIGRDADLPGKIGGSSSSGSSSGGGRVGRARNVLSALGEKPKGDAPGPSASDIANSFAGQSGVVASAKANNAVSFDGGAGPRQAYPDAAKDIDEFADSNDSFGAAAKAGVGSKDNPRAGLDIRGDVFTAAKTPDAKTIYCTKKDRDGSGRMGFIDSAFCAAGVAWDDLYGSDKSKLTAQPDLGVVLAKIRGYMLPSVLSPASAGFLQSVKAGDGDASEIYYKRQSYSTRRNMVESALNYIIKGHVAIGFASEDVKKTFNERWSKTYASTYAPPPAPSELARRDLLIDYYNSDAYLNILGTVTNGGWSAQQVQMQALDLKMQREILNSLQNITALLASSASSDLFDDRDVLERAGNQANAAKGSSIDPNRSERERLKTESSTGFTKEGDLQETQKIKR